MSKNGQQRKPIGDISPRNLTASAAMHVINLRRGDGVVIRLEVPDNVLGATHETRVGDENANNCHE